MEDPMQSGMKTDRLLEAEPVTVGERHIQPMARMVGWDITGDEESAPFASKVGRLTPVEVRVRTGEDEEVIQVVDPVQEPLRGIFVVSVVLSIACTLIMLVARIGASRQSRRQSERS